MDITSSRRIEVRVLDIIARYVSTLLNLWSYFRRGDINSVKRAILRRVKVAGSHCGPVFRQIHDVFGNHDAYGRFQNGRFTRGEFADFVRTYGKTLKRNKLPTHMMLSVARFPKNEETFVDGVLLDLKNHGVLP